MENVKLLIVSSQIGINCLQFTLFFKIDTLPGFWWAYNTLLRSLSLLIPSTLYLIRIILQSTIHVHPQGTETLSRKSTVWKKTPHILSNQYNLITKHLTHFAVTPKPTQWMLSHLSVRTGHHAAESREQIWQQLSAATQGSVQTFTSQPPALPHLQGWLSHSFSGQHVPVPQHLTASNLPCSCPLLKGFKFQSNDPVLKEKKKLHHPGKKKNLSLKGRQTIPD